MTREVVMIRKGVSEAVMMRKGRMTSARGWEREVWR